MIREYRQGDLWLVLNDIRQSELDEAKALGEDPEPSLKYAIYAGETVTLEINGKVCGLAGIVPYENVFMPWAVFTSDIEKCPITFLKECRRWIKRYNLPMYNLVDARNKTAQNWLRWLGMTLGEPIPYGVDGAIFLPYWRKQWAG